MRRRTRIIDRRPWFKDAQAMLSKPPTRSEYLDDIPGDIPAGHLLVHNDKKPGDADFRFWLQTPSLSTFSCNCRWGGREHFSTEDPDSKQKGRKK